MISKRRGAISTILAAALSVYGYSAAAQERPANGGGSASNVSDTPPAESRGMLEGEGVQVGEGLVLHPQTDLATVYQNNVYSQSNDDPTGKVSSPILRIGIGGELATTDNSQASRLQFRSSANFTWHQYLGSDKRLDNTNDLGIGVLLEAKINPNQPFSFVLRDGFTRSVRPPRGALADNLDRDRNELLVGALYKPGGGALQGYLNYGMSYDRFETELMSYPDRMANKFTLGGRWQWLPMTQLLLEGQWAIATPSKETAFKSSSTPLRVTAGISSLITSTFGTVVRVGYGNGFYKTGANFNSYLALVEGRFAFGPMVRLSLGYSHDFTDSVVSNFYTDHAFYARSAIKLGQSVDARLRGELRLRSYPYGKLVEFDDGDSHYRFCGDEGCASSDRSDTILNIDGGIDYHAAKWLTLGVGYSFHHNDTEFFVLRTSNGNQDSGAFQWHEVMAKAAARF
ncbi:MAG: hypothetical protein V2A73_15735 [Pseudomonadota bacterium]